MTGPAEKRGSELENEVRTASLLAADDVFIIHWLWFGWGLQCNLQSNLERCDGASVRSKGKLLPHAPDQIAA